MDDVIIINDDTDSVTDTNSIIGYNHTDDIIGVSTKKACKAKGKALCTVKNKLEKILWWIMTRLISVVMILFWMKLPACKFCFKYCVLNCTWCKTSLV